MKEHALHGSIEHEPVGSPGAHVGPAVRKAAFKLWTHALIASLPLATTACESEPALEPGRAPAEAPHSAITQLFDGRTLDGWEGDPRYWSVEEGAIVGRSTEQNPLTETTYLLWRGGSVADFELAVEFRIEGGNSGVQFRSRDLGGYQVGGYQADIEDGPNWTGCLYEQDGRGVVGRRGEQVRLDAGGRSALQVDDPVRLLSLVQPRAWNRYVVRALGNRIELAINGVRMLELVDDDEARRAASGLLALQLHAGPPMQVAYRNFELRELTSAPAKPGADGARAAQEESSAQPGPGAGSAGSARTDNAISGTLERAQRESVQPSWIWRSSRTPEDDVSVLWRTFELRDTPVSARLRGSADNHARVFVNGTLVLTDDEWETPFAVDVATQVTRGTNTIALAAKNGGGPAGVWLELVVEGAAGGRLRLCTDASWSAGALPESTSYEGWTPEHVQPGQASSAHVIGALGCGPWGWQGDADQDEERPRPREEALDADALELLPGFHAELLYSVPKDEQGSWVSICTDPRGRFYTSDQGGGLYRVTVGATGADTQVEPVLVELGRAHGLCWAFDALYVVVSEDGGAQTGLYRVEDTDGDDRLDHARLLRELVGSGEHGPHAVVLGPDDALWIVAGNFTKLPKPLHRSRVPETWAEDELLPHLPDPNGHDPHIKAPGGWVVRTDREGREWELFAVGLRNSYDLAFGPEDELFTFDSDMEWDIGAPWYRPTRILHVVSGADYGWRNGSAKWNADWPDTLPSVCDLGPTSPTGVAFGTSTRFPPRYQRALFACDWAYGTIYAVHLEARGSSFGATHDVFARGKPFPVTDVVVGADGALYVTVGGRGTQSGLYRITWTGSMEDEPRERERERALSSTGDARATRRAHADLHRNDMPGGARASQADLARGHRDLASDDPYLRHAARIVVERETETGGLEARTALAAALVARIHRDGAAGRSRTHADLARVELASASPRELIELLRVYQLLLVRGAEDDELDGNGRKQLGARLVPLLATRSEPERRELGRVLGALDVPEAIDPLLAEFAAATSQEGRIHFAHCLLATKTGWTSERLTRYLDLLDAVRAAAQGGHSLAKFVDTLRERAIDRLTAEERAAFGARIQPAKPAEASAAPAAAGFVRRWTRDELLELLREPARPEADTLGKTAFEKATCGACHRVGGAGGATGPDLTGAGARFNRGDLIESLLEPSKIVSDQYRDVQLVTKDGELFVGRIESETAEKLTLRRLPPMEDLIELARDEIEERQPHALSRMPAGLLDVLTKEEVRALCAYVLGEVDEKNPRGR